MIVLFLGMFLTKTEKTQVFLNFCSMYSTGDQFLYSFGQLLQLLFCHLNFVTGIT